MMKPRVRTGLDVLLGENFRRLRGRRVGLVGHPASVDARLVHAVRSMHAAGVKLSALFGPEHGITGAAQDMEVVVEGETATDPLTGARVFSLYGPTEDSLYPKPEMLQGLDVVVVDLQDVGARYYTFAATMGYLLRAASGTGIQVIVLDRPNPLGGLPENIEGPLIDPGYFSFVGAFNLPIRHCLTMGEYALFVRASERLDVELQVVAMEGWRRLMDFEATGLPWVMPSPNMPTVDTARVYPGQCLLEGTNLSEGRGTTRPFELCGAPWLDGEAWAARAQPLVGPGFVLRPATIKPTFQKHQGLPCGAVQVHVTEPWAVRSLRLSVALLRTAMDLAPAEFRWREEVYEYVKDRLAIDLLFGSSRPRELLEAGASTVDVLKSFEAVEREARERLMAYHIYR